MSDYQIPDVSIGYIHEFPQGVPIPDNWIKADGAVLNIKQYPKLYKKIGRMYCSNKDSNEVFRLPDFTEKMLNISNLSQYERQFTTVVYAIKAQD